MLNKRKKRKEKFLQAKTIWNRFYLYPHGQKHRERRLLNMCTAKVAVPKAANGSRGLISSEAVVPGD